MKKNNPLLLIWHPLHPLILGAFAGIFLLVLFTVGSGTFLSGLLLDQSYTFTPYLQRFHTVNSIIFWSAFIVIGGGYCLFYLWWRVTVSQQDAAKKPESASILSLLFKMCFIVCIGWILLTFSFHFIAQKASPQLREEKEQPFTPKSSYTLQFI